MEELTAGDPKRMGKYRLLGRLGTGGMGVVYLALSSESRRVAMKVLRPEAVDLPELRVRFAREIEISRSIVSDYTARYIDADINADRPYLVTEYVSGPNLEQLVNKSGPLEGAQLRALAIALASSLVELHELGLVHRDIKPSNVLVSDVGPVLIDFGIARFSDATNVTQVGDVLGSPAWMSPEQIKGTDITSASDIFSWASVITYAATGSPAFGKGDPQAVMYRILREEPTQIEGDETALRKALAACLVRDENERPTAADLVQTLLADAESLSANEANESEANASNITQYVTTHWRREIDSWEAPVDPQSRRGNRVIWSIVAMLLVISGIGGVTWTQIDHDATKTKTVASATPETTTSSITTSIPAATTTEATTTTTTAPTFNARVVGSRLNIYEASATTGTPVAFAEINGIDLTANPDVPVVKGSWTKSGRSDFLLQLNAGSMTYGQIIRYNSTAKKWEAAKFNTSYGDTTDVPTLSGDGAQVRSAENLCKPNCAAGNYKNYTWAWNASQQRFISTPPMEPKE